MPNPGFKPEIFPSLCASHCTNQVRPRDQAVKANRTKKKKNLLHTDLHNFSGRSLGLVSTLEDEVKQVQFPGSGGLRHFALAVERCLRVSPHRSAQESILKACASISALFLILSFLFFLFYFFSNTSSKHILVN
jgi:hypothetical protein